MTARSLASFGTRRLGQTALELPVFGFGARQEQTPPFPPTPPSTSLNLSIFSPFPALCQCWHHRPCVGVVTLFLGLTEL